MPRSLATAAARVFRTTMATSRLGIMRANVMAGKRLQFANRLFSTVTGDNIRELRPGETAPIEKTDEEWFDELGEETFTILRAHGTEPPGSHEYNFNKKDGVYHCAGCNTPLFKSSDKYNSGTGWPSFFDSIPGAVVTKTDKSHFMVRTEILCASCHGHLGHVFPDGPKPTHLRHCCNGAALTFVPRTNSSN
mmetsp:Transcript_47653/g.78941  ORF Transcript_47653/g.78941 Transcript_47653/m.78941 type:complete len:192 (+) Transcript_47653:34-609(+)